MRQNQRESQALHTDEANVILNPLLSWVYKRSEGSWSMNKQLYKLYIMGRVASAFPLSQLYWQSVSVFTLCPFGIAHISRTPEDINALSPKVFERRFHVFHLDGHLPVSYLPVLRPSGMVFNGEEFKKGCPRV